MKSISDFWNVLLRSILAGIMIGIGGTVYLASESKVVGAFLFSIGLFIICCSGFNLFTGKIGYLANNGISYLKDLGVIAAGNFIGTYIAGLLVQNTRLTKVVEKAAEVANVKLSDDILSIFILACFCGALMYLGVDGYKTIADPVGKYLAVFMAVAVFILSGFEHCVANMFYFTLAGMWSWHALIYMGIMILGNSAGALFFSFSNLLINRHNAVAEAQQVLNSK